MVFSSTVFLFLFLPLTILIYYNPVWRGRRFRNDFLLFVSLLFYAYGEPLFVFLMLLAIGAGWFIGLKIGHAEEREQKKRWLVLGCTGLVSMPLYLSTLLFVVSRLACFCIKICPA